jgi:hypothetical protein
MDEIEAQFGITPGKAVPRVKASDLKAVWKMGRNAEAHAMAHSPELKRGQLMIGIDLMKRVCSPDANVNAVVWRGMRLGMLMARYGGDDVEPPSILFTIFANLPMKCRGFGESHRALF